MTLFAGIDAGSRAIKVAILNGDTREVVASGLRDQGIAQEDLTRDLLNELLRKVGAHDGDVAATVATGYGRNLIRFADTTITEITCHAHGVRHVSPGAMTIIEVGGQDSKLIRLDGQGAVRDFAMNDRCAAGTGRFLEVIAGRLGVDLAALGPMAAKSANPATISSMCVVFAETEIVGLLASGIPPEDIVCGVQTSLAKRVTAMAGRSVDEPVVFTGGVALIPGMVEAMAKAVGRPVSVVPTPQLTGAIGAALLAMKR